MSIYIHIERLILDGLPVTSSHGVAVQAAVEAELSGVLAEQGLNRVSGGAVPHLVGGSIQLTKNSGPAQIGRQIAQAIYVGLGPTPMSPRPRGPGPNGGPSA